MTPMPPAVLSENLSIAQMFGVSSKFSLDSAANEDAVKDLKANLPAATPWQAAQSEISNSLTETLHSGLFETLAFGWKRYELLMEAARDTLKSPGSKLVPLAEHSIDSALHPYVEIFVGPKSIQKIEFEVTLTTTIRGLNLGLRRGQIVSIHLVDCDWTGKIALGKCDLIEHTVQPFVIPGTIELTRPITLIHV